MKKKLKKIAGWVLFGLVALTIIIAFEGQSYGQNVPFRVSVKGGRQYITILRSSINDRVVWTTFGATSKFYSELGQSNLQRNVTIPFDDTINFWIIDQYKTTSVQYVSPLSINHYPIIVINGINSRTGEILPNKFWDYNYIVPIITLYYEYYYEDEDYEH